MNQLLFVLFIPLYLLFSRAVNAVSTCWYPDGNTKEPGHVPCNQTSNAPSICCASRDACAGSFCLSINGPYRGSCTDQSWESPGCAARDWPQCVTDPSTRRRYNRIAPLYPCSPPGMGGSKVCCGYSNGSSCCNNEFQISHVGPAFSPGSDILSTNITTTAQSNMTNITTIPTIDDNDFGIKIGLGIGIPLGFLFTGILGFLFYREFNKNKLLNNPVGFVSTKKQPSMEHQSFYQEYIGSANLEAPLPPPPPPPPPSAFSTNINKLEAVYEAPISDVHEMRG